MKIINIFTVVFLVFCSSCEKNEYQKRERLENKVIGQTWRQLEREKNLSPVGEGGSIVEGNEFLGLYFQYFHPLTIDEARQLVVYAAQTFQKNLNESEKLIEVMKKPYPMNWIEIQIFLFKPDYSNIEYPSISLIHFQRDNIKYLSERKHFEIIQEETYEEALEKLK